MTLCQELFTWNVEGESTLVGALLRDLREEGVQLTIREAGDPANPSDAQEETVRGGKADMKVRIHSQLYEHMT